MSEQLALDLCAIFGAGACIAAFVGLTGGILNSRLCRLVSDQSATYCDSSAASPIPWEGRWDNANHKAEYFGRASDRRYDAGVALKSERPEFASRVQTAVAEPPQIGSSHGRGDVRLPCPVVGGPELL